MQEFVDPVAEHRGIVAAAVLAGLTDVGYAAWLGSPAFRRAMLPVLGAAFVAGAATLAMTTLK